MAALMYLVAPLLGSLPYCIARYLARLLGIPAPELRGVCEKEKALGRKARDRLAELIEGAEVVELRRGPPCKYSQLTAWLIIDGEDVAEVLIAEGLALTYEGGAKPGWCGPEVTQPA